jgi:hypothetical protein
MLRFKLTHVASSRQLAQMQQAEAQQEEHWDAILPLSVELP